MFQMNTTQIVMASAVFLLLAYDVYAVVHGGLQETISYEIVKLSKTYPFIPFALGFLMGHFFGQCE